MAAAEASLATDRSDWNTCRFDQIAENITERVDNPASAGVERYVGLEHLEADSLTIRRWGHPSDVSATKLMFRKGDIIFGRRRAYQRKLAVADYDGICSAHALVLRARQDVVIPEFLPFFLQSETFFSRALSISVGSLSPTINWRTLAKQEFALPPKPVQQRIASVLGAATEEVQAARNVAQSLAGLRVSLRKDRFLGLNDYDHGPLADAGTWVSGGTPARANADAWSGTLPWASPKDIKRETLPDTEEHITREAAETESKVVPRDSLLIVVRGMILAHTLPIAITQVEVAINQDIKALIPSDEYEPWFIYYFVTWRSKQILGMTAESTHGTKRLPTPALQSLQLPSPPREVQESIVAELQEIERARELWLEKADRAQALLRSLSVELLEGKRGV